MPEHTPGPDAVQVSSLDLLLIELWTFSWIWLLARPNFLECSTISLIMLAVLIYLWASIHHPHRYLLNRRHLLSPPTFAPWMTISGLPALVLTTWMNTHSSPLIILLANMILILALRMLLAQILAKVSQSHGKNACYRQRRSRWHDIFQNPTNMVVGFSFITGAGGLYLLLGLDLSVFSTQHSSSILLVFVSMTIIIRTCHLLNQAQAASEAMVLGIWERSLGQSRASLASFVAHELVGAAQAGAYCCEKLMEKQDLVTDRYLHRLENALSRVVDVLEYLKQISYRAVDPLEKGSYVERCHQVACSILQFENRMPTPISISTDINLSRHIKVEIPGPELVHIFTMLYDDGEATIIDDGKKTTQVQLHTVQDQVVIIVKHSKVKHASNKFNGLQSVDFQRASSLVKLYKGHLDMKTDDQLITYTLTLPLIR